MPPKANIDTLCDCPCEYCNLLHYMCKCDLIEQRAAIIEIDDDETQIEEYNNIIEEEAAALIQVENSLVEVIVQQQAIDKNSIEVETNDLNTYALFFKSFQLIFYCLLTVLFLLSIFKNVFSFIMYKSSLSLALFLSKTAIFLIIFKFC